jgi:hypothetical protein
MMILHFVVEFLCNCLSLNGVPFLIDRILGLPHLWKVYDIIDIIANNSYGYYLYIILYY